MTNHAELINHAVLEQAQTALEKATLKLQNASRQHAAEAASHDDAKRLATRAEVAGDESVHDTAEALAVAERRAGTAARVLAAAEKSHAEARDALTQATAVAHRPVYIQGVKMRLAAARKADTARKLLAEAEAEHRSGTETMLAAMAHGQMDVTFGRFQHYGLSDTATELKLFTENTHTWWWDPKFIQAEG